MAIPNCKPKLQSQKRKLKNRRLKSENSKAKTQKLRTNTTNRVASEHPTIVSTVRNECTTSALHDEYEYTTNARTDFDSTQRGHPRSETKNSRIVSSRFVSSNVCRIVVVLVLVVNDILPPSITKIHLLWNESTLTGRLFLSLVMRQVPTQSESAESESAALHHAPSTPSSGPHGGCDSEARDLAKGRRNE
jgi:hypothetical protein